MPDAQVFIAEGLDVKVTITESAGPDGAVVVFVDTEFEPDASDGGRGLRVLLNDDPVYSGVEFLGPENDVDAATCWVLGCVTPHDDVREVAVIKGEDEFDVEFCKRHREIHRPSLNPVHKKRLSLNVMTPILAFDLRGTS